MAEPAEPPPDMTDVEEGWLTDGEEDSGAATSDYRAAEQHNVSGQSGEEAQSMAMKKKTMKVVVKKWNIVATPTATILKKRPRLS